MTKKESFVRSEDPVEYVVQHGGKREGAGRKGLGVTKKCSITLPKEVWEQIDQSRGEESLSSFLRRIVMDGNWI